MVIYDFKPEKNVLSGKKIEEKKRNFYSKRNN